MYYVFRRKSWVKMTEARSICLLMATPLCVWEIFTEHRVDNPPAIRYFNTASLHVPFSIKYYLLSLCLYQLTQNYSTIIFSVKILAGILEKECPHISI